MEQTSSQIAGSVPGCLSFQMKGDTRSLLCLQAVVPGAGSAASRKQKSLLSDIDFSGTRRAGEIRVQLPPASNIYTALSHQPLQTMAGAGGLHFCTTQTPMVEFVQLFCPYSLAFHQHFCLKKGIWTEVCLTFTTLLKIILYKTTMMLLQRTLILMKKKKKGQQIGSFQCIVVAKKVFPIACLLARIFIQHLSNICSF